jgi:hypothetical protein
VHHFASGNHGGRLHSEVLPEDKGGVRKSPILKGIPFFIYNYFWDALSVIFKGGYDYRGALEAPTWE